MDREQKRFAKALEALRFECDYEDGRNNDEDNFVTKGALGVGIGYKTLSQLEEQGLLRTGQNRWHRAIGYRITAKGREYLDVWRKLSVR